MRLGRDAVTGLGVLALAIAYWLVADRLQVSLLADAVGADGVPKVLAVALAMLGALLAFSGWRAGPEPASAESAQSGAHLRAAGLLAIGCVYVVLMPILGFALVTSIVIVVVAAYAGLAMSRNLVAIGAIAGGVFWFMFVKLLGISMPTGMWLELIG